MKPSQNPFAEPAAAHSSTSWREWLLGVVALAAVAGAIVAGAAFRQQTRSLELVRKELDDVRAAKTQTQAEAADLWQKLSHTQSQLTDLSRELGRGRRQLAETESKLASSQAQIQGLECENETANQNRQSLEEQMRAELQSKDVTISRLQGKLTVNILDRILFDSGEAVLKSGGESVLEKIAGILEQHPALKIHVVGHTDNVPIRANSRSRFPTNWELSTARALAAVRFLVEKAGIDPHRVGALGYGEFRPIADNGTPEGRAHNRRIAITILADELAGADSVPGANSDTSAPEPQPAVQTSKTSPEPPSGTANERE